MGELTPIDRAWRRIGIWVIPINLLVVIVDVLWLLMATAEGMAKLQVGIALVSAVVGFVAAIAMVRKPRPGWWPQVAMIAGAMIGIFQSYYVIGMSSFQ